ncbi:hypothetical protein J4462_04780 [Candidatus Pacearchaeota archaeon]|nr:hypothetical protein [Candidatus Pacearchaeota archaeon]
MVNKKAQDLSIGTLILIVLGIVVLVLLILGFSLGWSNLWQKIGIFGGTSSIADVVIACKLAATSQDTYGYCQDFKEIKIDGKTEYVNCEDPRVSSGLDNKLACNKQESELKKEQCINLVKNNKIKIDSKVNGKACERLTCEELGGSISSEGKVCEIGKTQIENVLDGNSDAKEFCCVIN